MNEKVTNLVKKQLSEIFKNYPHTADIHELIEELKSDLTTAAEDKVGNGQQADVAVSESFREFGDITALIEEVMQEHDLVGDLSNKSAFSKFDEQCDDYIGDELYIETLNLVHEKSFDVQEVQHLVMTYDHATVRVLPADGDKIILREYMSRDNTDYFAKVRHTEGALTITQGRYPRFLHLKIRIQLLIPQNFAGNLQVMNYSGNLYMSGIRTLGAIQTAVQSGNARFENISAKNFTVKAQSGKLKLERVKARDQVRLFANSGTIRLDHVLGHVLAIKAHSGSIRGEEISGSGTIESHSGTVALSMSELTDDLAVVSRSGSVRIMMLIANYKFDLQAKSGTVHGPEHAHYDHNTTGFKDGYDGNHPTCTVRCKALSGTVKLA